MTGTRVQTPHNFSWGTRHGYLHGNQTSLHKIIIFNMRFELISLCRTFSFFSLRSLMAKNHWWLCAWFCVRCQHRYKRGQPWKKEKLANPWQAVTATPCKLQARWAWIGRLHSSSSSPPQCLCKLGFVSDSWLYLAKCVSLYFFKQNPSFFFLFPFSLLSPYLHFSFTEVLYH